MLWRAAAVPRPVFGEIFMAKFGKTLVFSSSQLWICTDHQQNTSGEARRHLMQLSGLSI